MNETNFTPVLVTNTNAILVTMQAVDPQVQFDRQEHYFFVGFNAGIFLYASIFGVFVVTQVMNRRGPGRLGSHE